MGRPQPEPSLFEDVGATEVSQLATEWREHLRGSQAIDEEALSREDTEAQPQVTLGEESSHRLIPAVGIGLAAPGPQRRPGAEAKSSLPMVAALPLTGPQRQPQKIALVPPASQDSPEPPIALGRPSQKSKPAPVVPVAARASAQLPVLGPPQRRSGQLPASTSSRISGVLPELAPPHSADPSQPGSAGSLRRGSDSAKSLPLAAKDEKASSERNRLVFALAGIAMLSLAANLFSLFRGPAAWRVAPAAAAAAPAAAHSQAATSSSPSVAACLRESSQTIPSEERDELLLRAVQAFENGKQDQASNLLQRYVHEACDAATLEAVAILNQQREPSGDGKGASR